MSQSSTKSSPVVSIIIPTQNRAGLLRETLASVLAQSFQDWEAIVIDDHSKDETAEQTRHAAANDPRIRLLTLNDPARADSSFPLSRYSGGGLGWGPSPATAGTPPPSPFPGVPGEGIREGGAVAQAHPGNKSGAPAARNLGIAESRGEFIIFLDSDDLLAPHCLEQRLAFINARPDLDFALFPCQLFRERAGDVELLWNRKTEENDLDRFLKLDVPWQTTSPIWRRTALAKIGPWDETVLSGQDWEFHIRALLANLKYEWCEPPLFTPDCFWQRASGERDSIGKQSFGPQHIRARRDIILKIQGMIERAGQMTAARKEMFAGMYFDAATKMADRVSRKDAREIWRSAARASAINSAQLRQGLIHFLLYRWPNKRAKHLRKLEHLWPANFFVRPTAIYLRTPLIRSETPAVSVVMSAYNAETYLREAIESIVNQSFGDWEFIIIDDGSTDETLSILREFESRDARFRIVTRPNTGLAKALNEAVALARGEFIARMDADDVSLSRRFELEVARLRTHPNCVLVGGQVELIDPLGLRIAFDHHKLAHHDIESGLLAGKGGAIVHPACMMRTSAVRQIGAYREQFNNSEDLDLFLRLGEIGELTNLPDVVLKYRRHPQSVSHQKYENQWKLNEQIVTEAYGRRGLKMPENWAYVPWKPQPIVAQLREWAWAALKAGKVGAARQHAMAAFKKSPLSGDSWRLMFCALRGR